MFVLCNYSREELCCECSNNRNRERPHEIAQAHQFARICRCERYNWIDGCEKWVGNDSSGSHIPSLVIA